MIPPAALCARDKCARRRAARLAMSFDSTVLLCCVRMLCERRLYSYSFVDLYSELQSAHPFSLQNGTGVPEFCEILIC
eukprot:COSAG05_NODE_1936_length_3813_cov_4.841680_1_plen_78_part_00